MFLAALVYSIDAEKPLDALRRRDLILETARILTAIQGVDVFMSEFPVGAGIKPDPAVWGASCAALSQASRVPWLMISSSTDFNVFLRLAETACQQGACGVAVGRAVWQEAVAFTGGKLKTHLMKTCRARLSRLAAICEQAARSWHQYYAPPELSADWYSTYPGMINNS